MRIWYETAKFQSCLCTTEICENGLNKKSGMMQPSLAYFWISVLVSNIHCWCWCPFDFIGLDWIGLL